MRRKNPLNSNSGSPGSVSKKDKSLYRRKQPSYNKKYVKRGGNEHVG